MINVPVAGLQESTVQTSLSLQEADVLVCTQPVSGLQESAVHALLSLHEAAILVYTQPRNNIKHANHARTYRARWQVSKHDSARSAHSGTHCTPYALYRNTTCFWARIVIITRNGHISVDAKLQLEKFAIERKKKPDVR